MATDNKDKVLNVPNLRFPEFCEEWMRCTLGDITENFSRRNKEEIHYPMFSVTNNKGFIPQSEQFEDREMIGEDIKAYKIIHRDDFAYNPARINVGSIAKYNEENPCMISSLYVCFKTNPKIDNDWMMQLLKTPKMNFYYNINGEGGVRIYLFYPNFARIKTSYPTVKEQQKISSFLNLLDERISTQNKIIEDLKKLKSAISANLFMNNDWEQYPIGDLCNSLPVKSYICPFVSEDGAYPIIKQGDNPIVGYTKSKPFKTYNDVVLFGDHTLSIYRPNAPFLLFTDGLKILERKALVTRDFLYYLLCFYRPKSEGYKRHYSILKDIYVPVPTIKKQKQISAGLLNVDIKIDIAEKIEKLYQKQKQYLLAQMFI